MKRITIIVDDHVELDLSPFTSIAKHISYDRVDDEVIPPKRHKRAARKEGHHGYERILEHGKANKRFTIRDAEKWMRQAGYNNASASPALCSAVKLGFVERIKRGHFKFPADFTDTAEVSHV